MSFSVDTIELSMASPDTGEYMTANVYYVEGVKDASNNLRPLSIGQLVMALCLQRAANLEAKIVSMMDDMNDASDLLTLLTDIEKNILDEFQKDTSAHAYELANVTVDDTPVRDFLVTQGVLVGDEHFVRNDKLRPEAEEGAHDDCVMALAIAHYVRPQQSMTVLYICASDVLLFREFLTRIISSKSVRALL